MIYFGRVADIVASFAVHRIVFVFANASHSKVILCVARFHSVEKSLNYVLQTDEWKKTRRTSAAKYRVDIIIVRSEHRTVSASEDSHKCVASF